ncbi:ATP-binding protein [Eubacterium oxidoreducens]|uniref:PP-loop family protein n=1 Tax=Eubacterium oxidoreducens TaxID=1732 RepID=A0A1G6BCC8_EUBOX|nr:PP-loop family protein [Eubacterium oxidoreducens]
MNIERTKEIERSIIKTYRKEIWRRFTKAINKYEMIQDQDKIALGHHFDDVIETIVMGMLYGGQMQSMRPKLHSTNFEGMELIRPMYLIREADIIRWKNGNDLCFCDCACKVSEKNKLGAADEAGSKRHEVKQLIASLAAKNPIIEKNIFKSSENVSVDTLLAYKKDGVKHHFLDTYEQ